MDSRHRHDLTFLNEGGRQNKKAALSGGFDENKPTK
jgi:hypothetical protein